eukprot:4031839-Amphidinium_carterae.1
MHVALWADQDGVPPHTNVLSQSAELPLLPRLGEVGGEWFLGRSPLPSFGAGTSCARDFALEANRPEPKIETRANQC